MTPPPGGSATGWPGRPGRSRWPPLRTPRTSGPPWTSSGGSASSAAATPPAAPAASTSSPTPRTGSSPGSSRPAGNPRSPRPGVYRPRTSGSPSRRPPCWAPPSGAPPCPSPPTPTAAGYGPPKRTALFTGQQVRNIISKHAIRENAKGRPAVLTDLDPGEWSVPGLSAELGMPTASIYNWIYRSWITARRAPGGRNWIITADDEQMRQLRERRDRPPGNYTRARWAPPQAETGETQEEGQGGQP